MDPMLDSVGGRFPHRFNCNSSPNKHGTKHFLETGHPIIRSYEPVEDWKWCYADDIFSEKIFNII
jgi:ubiquitin-hydrolase Zn-finger-containing protein